LHPVRLSNYYKCSRRKGILKATLANEFRDERRTLFVSTPDLAGSHRESLGLDHAATIKKEVELVRLNATHIYRLICNLKPSYRLK
jgi:hypothetical protein